MSIWICCIEKRTMCVYCLTSCLRMNHSDGNVTFVSEGLQPFGLSLGTYNLLTRRDLSRAMPAVTRGLGFRVSSGEPTPLVPVSDKPGVIGTSKHNIIWYFLRLLRKKYLRPVLWFHGDSDWTRSLVPLACCKRQLHVKRGGPLDDTV